MASSERTIDQAISPLIDDLLGHLDETLVRIPPADFATLMSGLLTATTAAAFLTSASAPARGEGAITVTAEGIPLEEVSATASEISASNLGGYHRINSKGVKYRVLAGAQGWDVRGFGGRLDGITDDSVAVRRAVWAAIGAKAATAVGGNDVVPSAIYFAGGECRITQPRALLDETGAGRGFGLSYVGATPGTTINFDHDGEDYLCYNANEFLTVTFRNLRFTADSDNVRFMYSNGAGGAQDVMYERCTWDGVWHKLYRLEGANNNSEWCWSNCNITC